LNNSYKKFTNVKIRFFIKRGFAWLGEVWQIGFLNERNSIPFGFKFLEITSLLIQQVQQLTSRMDQLDKEVAELKHT
jgi:hypothetical protein